MNPSGARTAWPRYDAAECAPDGEPTGCTEEAATLTAAQWDLLELIRHVLPAEAVVKVRRHRFGLESSEVDESPALLTLGRCGGIRRAPRGVYARGPRGYVLPRR
jgi:hypothetical protein